ncbi:MAG: hypothetical protein EOO71_01280 [Myxococcaceae bacterium]|nr:MAG: hypothetical protein EOO71_01280 [Myxococcaceae bacterium]
MQTHSHEEARKGAFNAFTQVYDAKADAPHLAVLDARRPEDGPVARCHLDHALTPTFHGGFAPAQAPGPGGQLPERRGRPEFWRTRG